MEKGLSQHLSSFFFSFLLCSGSFHLGPLPLALVLLVLLVLVTVVLVAVVLDALLDDARHWSALEAEVAPRCGVLAAVALECLLCLCDEVGRELAVDLHRALVVEVVHDLQELLLLSGGHLILCCW